MKKSIYLLAIGVLAFTACTNEAKKTEAGSDMHASEMNEESASHNDMDHEHGSMGQSSMGEKVEMGATSEKNPATSGIIDAYLQIKNGLVADDKDGAAKGGEMLLKEFSSFDMTKLTAEQHGEYMEIVENATEQAEHIVKSPIDHQREHFEVLSNDISDLIALVGTDKTLYQDFCPMYNNNKGGVWLSETKEINNPYFGSKMLKCGSVQKQIN